MKGSEHLLKRDVCLEVNTVAEKQVIHVFHQHL